MALRGPVAAMAEVKARDHAPAGRLPDAARGPHLRFLQDNVDAVARLATWDERFLKDGGAIELIDDPLYWDYRALEAISIARLCEDEISRNIMLQLAKHYEELRDRCR